MVTLWFRMLLALPPDRIGLSQLLVPLFGIALHLTCVLYGNFMVSHAACTATKQNRAFSIVGSSFWNGPPHLACVLSRRNCLTSFIKKLRTSSLVWPRS